MNSKSKFSFQSFQIDVLKDIQYFQVMEDPLYPIEEISKSVDFSENLKKNFMLRLTLKFMFWLKIPMTNSTPVLKKRLGVDKHKKEAETWIKQKDIKRILDKSLAEIKDDAFEIGKIISPELFELRYDGKHIFPYDSKLVAMMAILLAQKSVKNF